MHVDMYICIYIYIYMYLLISCELLARSPGFDLRHVGLCEACARPRRQLLRLLRPGFVVLSTGSAILAGKKGYRQGSFKKGTLRGI